MNKEEKVKYTCHDCFYACHRTSNEICDKFKKRIKIVLEFDGVRHVLKSDVRVDTCYLCSLRETCFNKDYCICDLLDGHGYGYFELEK